MSEKAKGTRTRAPNFSKQDQFLLFDAMKAYTHIIGSKQTDSVKQADKQFAWEQVTDIFNANAVGQHRTTENLISCYRNVKSKLKKLQAESKMYGGPNQLDANEDELTQLKKFYGPQYDGIFTIYDSDEGLMSQYQSSIPEAEQIKPIELTKPLIDHIKKSPDTIARTEKKVEESNNNLNTPSRTKIIHKNKEPGTRNQTNFRKTVINKSYRQLSEAKLELVKMQKLLLEKEFIHKQKLQEIELEEIIKESKFKEIYRAKELELMDLKIKTQKSL